MFGLSFIEIGFVLVVAFLIFGPEQFPVMLKKAIVLIRDLKKHSFQAQQAFHKLTRQVESEFDVNNWIGSEESKHQVERDVASALSNITENSEEGIDEDDNYECTPYAVFEDECDLIGESDEAFESIAMDVK